MNPEKKKKVKHPIPIPIITPSASTTNSFVGDVKMMGMFDHFLNFFFPQNFHFIFQAWLRQTPKPFCLLILKYSPTDLGPFLISGKFYQAPQVSSLHHIACIAQNEILLQNHCRNKDSGLWQLFLYPLK